MHQVNRGFVTSSALFKTVERRLFSSSVGQIVSNIKLPIPMAVNLSEPLPKLVGKQYELASRSKSLIYTASEATIVRTHGGTPVRNGSRDSIRYAHSHVPSSSFASVHLWQQSLLPTSLNQPKIHAASLIHSRILPAICWWPRLTTMSSFSTSSPSLPTTLSSRRGISSHSRILIPPTCLWSGV